MDELCRMVKSTSSRQASEISTSVIKNVVPPRHTKFCRFAQEFHEERGLSLVGVDPRSLSGNSDILEKEWDAVFTCPMPLPGHMKKVKAYHVRPEFAEKLVHRHWDVYQEGPFNYEVGVQFAKAFAMENCIASRTGPKKEIYIIAWAPFAEKAMKSSEERHNIENKKNRWQDQMGGKGKKLKRDDGSTRSTKTDEVWPGVQEGLMFLFEDEEKQQLGNMKNSAQERLKMAKAALEDAHTQVEVEVRDLHRCEGAQQTFNMATMIQSEISSLQDQETRDRILALMSKFPAKPLKDIAQLEKDVAEAKVKHLCFLLFAS